MSLWQRILLWLAIAAGVVASTWYALREAYQRGAGDAQDKQAAKAALAIAEVARQEAAAAARERDTRAADQLRIVEINRSEIEDERKEPTTVVAADQEAKAIIARAIAEELKDGR